MTKELIELKNKMQKNLSRFKTYDEYVKYCNMITIEFLNKHKDLSIEDLKKELNKIK